MVEHAPNVNVIVKRQQDSEPWAGTLVGIVHETVITYNEDGFPIRFETGPPTDWYMVRDTRDNGATFDMFAHKSQIEAA